ncbi:hypothetical protein HYFRA_00003173 [Hymenoscyphus fraxineus]|uniref:Uncharacterized protein n=1 Tax=Hymenoscyphus fraxineus TaxID=746836 RepID=A0A9N9KU69_9HELO|nr:hypothetical protein HYFRA_00003173 [Hymenoscyphus fraxineus]
MSNTQPQNQTTGTNNAYHPYGAQMKPDQHGGNNAGFGQALPQLPPSLNMTPPYFPFVTNAFAAMNLPLPASSLNVATHRPPYLRDAMENSLEMSTHVNGSIDTNGIDRRSSCFSGTTVNLSEDLGAVQDADSTRKTGSTNINKLADMQLSTSLGMMAPEYRGDPTATQAPDMTWQTNLKKLNLNGLTSLLPERVPQPPPVKRPYQKYPQGTPGNPDLHVASTNQTAQDAPGNPDLHVASTNQMPKPSSSRTARTASIPSDMDVKPGDCACEYCESYSDIGSERKKETLEGVKQKVGDWLDKVPGPVSTGDWEAFVYGPAAELFEIEQAQPEESQSEHRGRTRNKIIYEYDLPAQHPDTRPKQPKRSSLGAMGFWPNAHGHDSVKCQPVATPSKHRPHKSMGSPEAAPFVPESVKQKQRMHEASQDLDAADEAFIPTFGSYESWSQMLRVTKSDAQENTTKSEDCSKSDKKEDEASQDLDAADEASIPTCRNYESWSQMFRVTKSDAQENTTKSGDCSKSDKKEAETDPKSAPPESSENGDGEWITPVRRRSKKSKWWKTSTSNFEGIVPIPEEVSL